MPNGDDVAGGIEVLPVTPDILCISGADEGLLPRRSTHGQS
jgi:hypothetical protein